MWIENKWISSLWWIYGFKRLSQEEIKNFDVNSIGENNPIGYVLEYDLEYPDELHDFMYWWIWLYILMNYMTFTFISNDMLSKYLSDTAKKYGIKVGDVKKQVPNLGNKNEYAVHYRNLQLYLSLAMKLTKIHRVLKFKQDLYWFQYRRKKKRR